MRQSVLLAAAAAAVCVGAVAADLEELQGRDFRVRIRVSGASGDSDIRTVGNAVITADGESLPLADGETASFDQLHGVVRISPLQPEGRLAVRVGNRWRHFRGDLLVPNPRSSSAVLVNELHVDEYLKGVLPVEMGSAPEDALAAQAIVARSEAFFKIGGDRHGGEYDLCDQVHCMVYRGADPETDESVEAVERTRGLVLTHDGAICDAVYCHSCGGVTGEMSDVWLSEGSPYLRARSDAVAGGGPPDLSSEAAMRRFLESPPPMMCDPATDLGPEDRRENFRWTVRYTPEGLGRTLGVGRAHSARVTERGESGRVIELVVEGSGGTERLLKSSAMRAALEEIKSSLFVVDEEDGDFVFSGAGYGHGVGLCQMGAIGRARRGQTWREILGAYYTGVRLSRVY